MIPLHEKGTPLRTWLHVEDTADAVLKIIEHEKINEIFNISGNYECQNLVVATKIIDMFFDSPVDHNNYLDFSFNRIGQDVRYSVDDSKLKNIGWAPTRNFNAEIQDIVEYYKKNFIW